jgi:hypothetical protein
MDLLMKTSRSMLAIRKLFVPLVLLAACTDDAPMHPTVLPTGVYALGESPDISLPLPFPILGLTGRVSHSLLGETIMFGAPGRVTRVRTIHRVLDGEESTYTMEFEQEYQIWGDSIELGRFTPCSANEYCIGNDAGRISVDRIELRSPSLQTGSWPPRAVFRRQ